MVRPWSGKVLAAGIGEEIHSCVLSRYAATLQISTCPTSQASHSLLQAHSEDSESFYSVVNQSLT